MSKVRIVIKSLPYSGRYGGYRPHSIQEVDIDEARELVASGHAYYEDQATEAQVETATVQPVSNAMKNPVEVRSEKPEEPDADSGDGLVDVEEEDF